MRLLLVKYGKRQFSRPYAMTETPAHFGVTALTTSSPYSLHTEYAAIPRKLSSDLQKGFPSLTECVRGIPKLWVSGEWAVTFANWLISLIPEEQPPAVIEIHPPFVQDCPDIPTFLGRFHLFAHALLAAFPATTLVLENRYGTQRHAPFLISTPEDCAQLAGSLPHSLKLCIDFPQFFTAVCKRLYPSKKEIEDIFARVTAYRDSVFSIHLWGRQNGYAHMGDLLSLFQGEEDVMDFFLQQLRSVFTGKTLYLVPEVNSKTEHLEMLLDQVEQGEIEIGPKNTLDGTA